MLAKIGTIDLISLKLEFIWNTNMILSFIQFFLNSTELHILFSVISGMTKINGLLINDFLPTKSVQFVEFWPKFWGSLHHVMSHQPGGANINPIAYNNHKWPSHSSLGSYHFTNWTWSNSVYMPPSQQFCYLIKWVDLFKLAFSSSTRINCFIWITDLDQVEDYLFMAILWRFLIGVFYILNSQLRLQSFLFLLPTSKVIQHKVWNC